MKTITRNTKIITTIGPASSNEKVIEKYLKFGVRAFRFNFSHGNHDEQYQKLQLIKKIAKKLNIIPTFILDTKGPEIRTHNFNGNIEIKKDSIIKIYCEKEVMGDKNMFSVTYKDLYKDIIVGSKILVDDGKLVLECKKIENKIIFTKAINTHIVTSKRGVNVPSINLSMPFLSKQDKKDLLFGCEHNFDWIAASFVSSKDDILQMQKFLKTHSNKEIKIISKVENQNAIKNLESVIKASDAIMIARGDLCVEIPYYKVPFYQLEMIRKCHEYKKPVVVATQMLESMIKEIMPTRAEINDVYLAAYFGCDSAMLSGESANGKNPIAAVDVMHNILTEADNNNDYFHDNINFSEIKNEKFSKYIKSNKKIVIFKENDYELILKLCFLRSSIKIVLLTSNNFNEYGFIYSVYTLNISNIESKNNDEIKTLVANEFGENIENIEIY